MGLAFTVPSSSAIVLSSAVSNHLVGAPECSTATIATEHSPVHVKKSVDVWSLGCIFSEAVVWVVRGWRGLNEYRRRRGIEASQNPGLQGSCCFHDGHKALKEVRNIRRNLAQDCRASDNISAGSDLHSMIDLMLQPRESRKEASELYDRAQQLLKRARSKLGPSADGPRSLQASRNGQASSHARQLPPKSPLGYISPRTTGPARLPVAVSSILLRDSPEELSSEEQNPPYSLPYARFSHAVGSVPQDESYHRPRQRRRPDCDGKGKHIVSQKNDYAEEFSDKSAEGTASNEDGFYQQTTSGPRRNQRQHRGNLPPDTQIDHPETSSSEEVQSDTGTNHTTAWVLHQRRNTIQAHNQENGIRRTSLRKNSTKPEKVQETLPKNSPAGTNPEPPILTVGSLRKWHTRGKLFGKNSGEKLYAEHYMEDLKKRDHVRYLVHTQAVIDGFARFSLSISQ